MFFSFLRNDSEFEQEESELMNDSEFEQEMSDAMNEPPSSPIKSPEPEPQVCFSIKFALYTG